MSKELVKISKLIRLVLRHQPEAIGLALDPNGWAEVDELIRLANLQGHSITREIVERVVAESDKRRFAFDESGQRIRANQGHSVEVDLQFTPQVPPAKLYHGTATRFLTSIREQGLIPGARQHVHLSADTATATKVGQRHGQPAVLLVLAAEMQAAGHAFFLSANGVWLTAHVPAWFLEFP